MTEIHTHRADTDQVDVRTVDAHMADFAAQYESTVKFNKSTPWKVELVVDGETVATYEDGHKVA